MGFSLAAAGAVIFIAIAVTGAHATTVLMDTLGRTHRAEEAAMAKATDAARSRIEVLNVTWNEGTGTLLVRNTGSVTLDARLVDLLADGLAAPVTSRLVEGASTSVWAPETDLALAFTTDEEPLALTVVAPSGAQAYWRA